MLAERPHRTRACTVPGIRAIGAFAVLAVLLGGPALAQSRAGVSRPHDYEAASSGYFRAEDTLPGAFELYIQDPERSGALWALGPRPRDVKRASFYPDAHAGVRGYPARRCSDCHERHDANMHSARASVTCVQCHRDRPIAGIFHYFSSMNPIRRHAYVCAKCHEGASASFATYVVHTPNPLAAATADGFPLLFYASWIMVILAGGVLLFFVPYVALWTVRELVAIVSGSAHRA